MPAVALNALKSFFMFFNIYRQLLKEFHRKLSVGIVKLKNTKRKRGIELQLGRQQLKRAKTELLAAPDVKEIPFNKKTSAEAFGTIKKPYNSRKNKNTLSTDSKEYLAKQAIAKRELQNWANEINGLITSTTGGGVPIVVENNVDLEGPPQDFTYIIDYKAGQGITIPTDPLVGCECTDCWDNRHSCCPLQSGSKFAYTVKGRVRLPRGHPIYECNKRCKCGPDCTNRVVQKGEYILVFKSFRKDIGH